jgi:DNA-binding response OmpR family regulator
MVQSNASILIVEDSPEISNMLSAVLEDEGYDVFIVGSVGAGVVFLANRPVDLILTDASSPTPQGAVASVQPLISAAGSRPVALMTGHQIARAEVLAQGFCALIQKPFDIDVMLEQVRSCLADLAAA